VLRTFLVTAPQRTLSLDHKVLMQRAKWLAGIIQNGASIDIRKMIIMQASILLSNIRALLEIIASLNAFLAIV
jgi:hypothetical protein